MRLVVVLSLLLLLPMPVWATDILCAGLDDTPAIQAALDAGGVVQLTGFCLLHQPLYARTLYTALRGPAHLRLSPDFPQPWMLYLETRELTVQDLVWWNDAGGGIHIDTPVGAPWLSGALRLIGGKFNTYYPGIFAWKGTGLWVWGTHFNAMNGGTYAAMIFEWDTASFTDVLVEGHWACMRMGSGTGGTTTISFMGVRCDGLASVGHLIEPWGVGHVAFIQDYNGWWSGGISPYLINASQTTGFVRDIQIRNGMAINSQMGTVWFYGPVERPSVVTEIQYR